MRTVELTDDQRKILLDGLGVIWTVADQDRMQSTPGSINETVLLDRQRRIEELEIKLR